MARTFSSTFADSLRVWSWLKARTSTTSLRLRLPFRVPLARKAKPARKGLPDRRVRLVHKVLQVHKDRKEFLVPLVPPVRKVFPVRPAQSDLRDRRAFLVRQGLLDPRARGSSQDRW